MAKVNKKAPKKSGQSKSSSESSEDGYVMMDQSQCFQCSKSLLGEEARALFVEEEVGRVFCSEDCITEFFAPEIEKLESEYLAHKKENDLGDEDRERWSDLRWSTLEEPSEVWREKMISGDYQHVLISRFEPEGTPIWSICITLFLKGEPSFLFLSFLTSDESLVDRYRKGEQTQWRRPREEQTVSGESADVQLTDGLADAWTEDETLRAELLGQRSSEDIPEDEFDLYENCYELTLENPDEVWMLDFSEKEGSSSLFHFIKYFPDDEEDPSSDGIWAVIVARESDEEDQLEVLDAFPTLDPNFVERYRQGAQVEIETEASSSSEKDGEEEERPAAAPPVSRMVH